MQENINIAKDKKSDKIVYPNTKDFKVILFGLITLLIVFGIFGGWMAIAPLATSSVAIGKVSADYNKKTIQHLDGGEVKDIYVKDGDIVEKNTPLLLLDTTQLEAQLQIASAQLFEFLAREARALAQIENKNKIIFPKELLEKQNISEVQNSISNQTKIFYAKQKSITNEKEITTQRINQLKEQILGLNALINSKIQRLKSINEEIKEWQALFQERLVDKERIRELNREKIMNEGDIANSKSEIAQLKVQTSEIQSQQLLHDKEFLNQTLNEISETQANISNVNAKILAIKDKIDKSTIKSPISGEVVGMNIQTIGGVIAPSKPILEIIPQNSKLIVIAKVNTADIDKVQKGLFADIRFSAFNTRHSHVIEGEVIHVSADSFIDEASHMPYYETKLKVTDRGKKNLKAYGFSLVAGMPAEVIIKTGDRTVLSYFVKPFTDMFYRSFNEE